MSGQNQAQSDPAEFQNSSCLEIRTPSALIYPRSSRGVVALSAPSSVLGWRCWWWPPRRGAVHYPVLQTWVCHVRSTLRFSADQSWAVGWQSLGTLVEAQRYGSHGRQSTVETSGQRVVWLLPFSLTSLSTGFVDVLAYVPLAQALSMHTPRRVVALRQTLHTAPRGNNLTTVCGAPLLLTRQLAQAQSRVWPSSLACMQTS